MIKEWATVVSWQNGQALVSCDVKASCSSCASRAGCGSRVLNKLGPQTTHTIVVPCEEPLVPGQKVELGIAEGSLLSSAITGLYVAAGGTIPHRFTISATVCFRYCSIMRCASRWRWWIPDCTRLLSKVCCPV